MRITAWIGGIILIGVALFNIWILINGNTYVYTAIRHGYAGIYDHAIFENREVTSANHIPLKESRKYGETALPDTLEDVLDRHESTAFLLLQNDSLLYENYWRSGHRDSLSGSFSKAKTVTALLIGIAKDQGYIDSLDDPAGKYYPPFNKDGKAEITIRHLLTKTSGLEWDEVYHLPISKTAEAYYGDDLPTLINRLEPEHPAGEQFRYKSADTQVLAFILEKATGQTLSAFASRHLWQPLGAQRNAVWSLDQAGGHEKAFTTFFATARDFARLGLLINNNGHFEERNVVSGDYISEMKKPVLRPDQYGEPADYYGFTLWRLPEYDAYEVYYLRGVYGQYTIIIPELNGVAVRLGYGRGPMKWPHWEDIHTLVHGMVKVLE